MRGSGTSGAVIVQAKGGTRHVVRAQYCSASFCAQFACAFSSLLALLVADGAYTGADCACLCSASVRAAQLVHRQRYAQGSSRGRNMRHAPLGLQRWNPVWHIGGHVRRVIAQAALIGTRERHLCVPCFFFFSLHGHAADLSVRAAAVKETNKTTQPITASRVGGTAIKTPLSLAAIYRGARVQKARQLPLQSQEGMNATQPLPWPRRGEGLKSKRMGVRGGGQLRIRPGGRPWVYP